MEGSSSALALSAQLPTWLTSGSRCALTNTRALAFMLGATASVQQVGGRRRAAVRCGVQRSVTGLDGASGVSAQAEQSLHSIHSSHQCCSTCLSQQGWRWPCAPALSTTTGRPRESTPSMYSRPAQGWQWAGRLGACTAAKRRSVPTASVCLLPDTQGAATSGSQALGQQHPPPHTHAPLNVWYHCGGNSSSGCAAASPPSPAGALVAAALMAASALAVS